MVSINFFNCNKKRYKKLKTRGTKVIIEDVRSYKQEVRSRRGKKLPKAKITI